MLITWDMDAGWARFPAAGQAAIEPDERQVLLPRDLDSLSATRRHVEHQSRDDVPMLATGTPAPEFTLPNQDGENVSLAELLAADKPVVLYFYPKADTPG